MSGKKQSSSGGKGKARRAPETSSPKPRTNRDSCEHKRRDSGTTMFAPVEPAPAKKPSKPGQGEGQGQGQSETGSKK